MSVLMLLPLAHADAAFQEPECELVSVVDTLPRPGAEAVPTNVSPVVFLYGDCDAPEDFLLEIVGGDEVFAAAVPFDASRTSQHIRFPDELDLQPDTAYEFRVLPGEGGHAEEVIVGFTTGAGPAGGLSGAPLVADGRAWFYDFDTSVEVGGRFQVSPAIDADDLSLLHVVDEDGSLSQTFVVEGGDLEVAVHHWEDSPPAEVCVSVFQEDATGAPSETDTLCVEPRERFVEDEGAGCATGGLAPSILLGLVGLLGLRRRR